MSSLLPNGWLISCLGECLNNKPQYGANTSALPFSDNLIRYIRITDIDNTGNLIDSVKVGIESSDAEGYILINNDLLIARTGNTVGKSYLHKSTNGKAAYAGYLIKFTLNNEKLLADYIFQYTQSGFYKKWVIGMLRHGAQPNINATEYSELELLLPPLPEQQKIAQILTSVDEVIEKTQAQIDKLKDLKTAMMQELLTKGIGHVEFKDSPVGKVPVGWEVKPLEELCSLVGVGIASSTTHAYTNIGVALLRNQNILRDGIRKTDMLYITEEFSEQNSSKKIYKRDVISIRTGYPGVSAVVPDEFDGCHSFTTLISRPIESLLNSDYLALLINSDYGQTFVTGGQAGGAQQNLNSSVLKAFPVILPPLEEQKAIFNTVEAISIKLRLIIDRKNKILATKKALMQDLLTGNVRVKVQ